MTSKSNDLKIEETLPSKSSNSSSEMDDETDSCFAYKKSNSQMYNKIKKTPITAHESDHSVVPNGSSPILSKIDQKPIKSPLMITIPHVIKKTGSASLVMPNIVSVKPSLSPASSNPIIDKIATNLKNKLLDKPIPKVSLVNKVNFVKQAPCKADQSPNQSRNILADESLNKMYAHKLILYKLSQNQNESENSKKLDEDEMNDDLTNLSWLTTFNLSSYMNSSKFNLLSLSPPKSPASSPSSPNSFSSLSHKSLNSTIRDYDDDEADSNALHAKKNIHNKILCQSLENILKKQDNYKPAYSFSCLIFLAIESSERKRLSVKEIYSWISQTFVYYSNVPSGSWKNSIRHNLSYNKTFCKVDKNLLAMRDFSGKGSLWCVDTKLRACLLDIFQKCTTSANLDELAKNLNLRDIHESPVKNQIRHLSVDLSQKKNIKIKLIHPSVSNSQSQTKNAQQPTIVNPKLIARLNSNPPKITNVKSNNLLLKSNSFNSAASTNLNSCSNLDACSEMDAVKALLSMKSKAASMPTILADDEKTTGLNQIDESKNRRKQLLKQPTKKCSKYDEEEDEENVDVEEDYFIDEEEDDEEFDESQWNEKSFSNECDPLTDNDENEENGKLEIDEDFDQEKKVSKSMDTNKNSNLLLELSRAAVLVENDEPIKKKLKTESKQNRSTRSMNNMPLSTSTSTKSIISINLSKTMTRSKSKLNDTK